VFHEAAFHKITSTNKELIKYIRDDNTKGKVMYLNNCLFVCLFVCFTTTTLFVVITFRLKTTPELS
jgi:hypothetical protein